LAAEPAAKTLSLEEALKTIGASKNAKGGGDPEFQWDPFLQSGTFYHSGHYASFQIGVEGEQGFSLIDGEQILNTPLPYMDKGALEFPELFVASVRDAFNEERMGVLGPFRVAAVIVDPGHGGKDSGAVGKHTIDGKSVMAIEKDIALTVSKSLYEKLRKTFPDKQVLMTRKTDTFIELDGRVSLANSISLKQNEAIIFIAVHCNAVPPKGNGRGYEIWYLPPNVRRTLIDRNSFDGPAEVIPILNAMKEEEFTIESKMLAKFILDRFSAVIGKSSPSRGIKENDWYVVKKANMPSVLVELGFVTDSRDAKLLTDASYVGNYAEALFRGISDFIAIYEKPGGFSIIE
jgi:N-acetylmuramoyl-L-alanine amidase